MSTTPALENTPYPPQLPTDFAAHDGVSAEEGMAELQRVLDSADFPATLRNRRFLSFVVEHFLQSGGKSRVLAYDVATGVFGRPESFNTILDPIVRIEAGKLRRDLETYYLKSGRRNPWRIEVPRGGYDPVFSRQEGIGFSASFVPASTGDLALDGAAELQRVVSSADFPATPRNRKFLVYVVERELAGRPEESTALLVATLVFGRGADFDTNNDPIVRIEASKLRRDLETYYLKSGRANPLRISLPKGGYRPVFSYQS
jgi:hypothetical protein